MGSQARRIHHLQPVRFAAAADVQLPTRRARSIGKVERTSACRHFECGTTRILWPRAGHKSCVARRAMSKAFRAALKWSTGAIGLGAGAYAVCVAGAWLRYGHASPPAADETDVLLDR